MRTKKTEEKWWNSENLRTLVENSGMTQATIAEASGIPTASFRVYLTEEAQPPIERLMALADVFAVPLDYICGRCTKEECDAIEESFADNFRLLRRKDYENCTLKRVEQWKKPDNYESPYPYNLLDDIFGKTFDHVISEDEANGLNYCIRALNEREQTVIWLRYEKEMTLQQTGKELNVTQERIRQIQAKALRKLKNPIRLNYILYGEQGNLRKQELDVRELQLNSRERILDERERIIDGSEKRLEEQKVMNIKVKKEILAAYDKEHPELGCSEAFLNMDWSVRAFNCLRRGRLNTVESTLKAIRTPDKYHIHDSTVICIRNVGLKVYNEILDKIEEATGEDLSDYRQGYNIFNADGTLVEGEYRRN